MVKKTQNILVIFAKWIHGNQPTFLAFVSILVIAEVFAFPISKDVRLFGGLFLYWYLSYIGKLTSVRTFQLCIILLTGMTIAYLTSGATAATERLAVWFVIFFAFGIFTQWREITA